MDRNTPMAVIGLGYVGLPAAVAFASHFSVIGFDTNLKRIQALQNAEDVTGELSKEKLQNPQLTFTHDPNDLKGANFFIIAVPTPLDANNETDLSALKITCELLGPQLKTGDVVVLESTVYPGVTENVCLPLLEQYSKLKAGQDFSLGYSPERINPADPEHGFANTVKVVSALEPTSLARIKARYNKVITKGVYCAASIKVAEASKLLENIQRDVNIALMNECTQIFQSLSIDSLSVLEAAKTKWNFMPYQPGFVGGHCIGVAPYHLMGPAKRAGATTSLMQAARHMNESMEQYVAQQVVDYLKQKHADISGRLITLLGFTYKENCHDIRFTRSYPLIEALQSHGLQVQVHDPIANPQDVYQQYKIELVGWDDLSPSDGMLLCVPHRFYKEKITEALLQKLNDPKWVFDFKGVLDKDTVETLGINVWRL